METRRALVIDDEADLRRYLSSILEEAGYTVEAAGSAEEAEVAIRARRPDVILLDLVMPGRGGIHFFVRLRGEPDTRDIPLVIVTGIKEQKNVDWRQVVERFKVRSPDGFVEKPVDPERLTRVVGEALVGRRSAGDPA